MLVGVNLALFHDRQTSGTISQKRSGLRNPAVFPSLKWLDYSDGKKGLTVIHRGIPENEIRDGDVYLTLLRSVLMLSSDGRTGPAIPVLDAQELRRYEFWYSIYPHKGDWCDASS